MRAKIAGRIHIACRTIERHSPPAPSTRQKPARTRFCTEPTGLHNNLAAAQYCFGPSRDRPPGERRVTGAIMERAIGQSDLSLWVPYNEISVETDGNRTLARMQIVDL